MEPKGFVAKLKATGSGSDFCDLSKSYEEYKTIIAKLPAKDRISFSLDVLCILCRNIDKVPPWAARVNVKDLLAMGVDCVRGTRPAQRSDRVSTLACIYHVHKFAVRQPSPVPPDLLLKLSYMPFEAAPDAMLPEHCKTYWNLLADRITYLERLKGEKRAVERLMPKLVEDYAKVLKISDSVYFCQAVLVFLVKKLYHLFSEGHAMELNASYKRIFEGLATKSDLKNFKKLSEKDLMNIYLKFNECFHTVMENSSKTKFKESIFYELVRTCITIIGHRSDLFHCLQTFYLNSFCNLLTEKVNPTFTETILSGMKVSCETTEKLSYKEAMTDTYPFIYQFLRMYMEYTISNADKTWKHVFTVEAQEACLRLVLFLMSKLKHTAQMLKCDNCSVKSGLHDSLRLSFPIKNVLALSLNHEMDLSTVLPVYLTLVDKQHQVLEELQTLKCRNHTRCVQKVQTDIHNTAILLHRSKNYAVSIQTFDVYLKHEIQLQSDDSDMKNISRGFYNKAICQLDCLLYEESLKSAFLSYLFSQPEGLKTEKHISLIIDVKAKLLKQPNEDPDAWQDLQQLTVRDVFQTCLANELFGDLRRFFGKLKLSALLKHEFDVYAKLWPSIGPIAGVLASLYGLFENASSSGLSAEDPSSLLGALYDVLLETPLVVRSVHEPALRRVALALLDTLQAAGDTNGDLDDRRMDKSKSAAGKEVVVNPAPSPDEGELIAERVLMRATLLFLKTEFDLADASVKYGWKCSEPSSDPDLISTPRTVPQEHAALKPAAAAVELLTRHLPLLMQSAAKRRVVPALRQWSPMVPLLQWLGRDAHALQLAHVICRLADKHDERESCVAAVGAILSSARGHSTALEQTLSLAGRHTQSLLAEEDTLQAALVFVCDAAIYSAACGSPGLAARLIQSVQARLLLAAETRPALDLDLAVGRLLDAQTALCVGAGPAAAVWAQRHYLALSNTASQWVARRYRGLVTWLRGWRASLYAGRRCRALLLWRRARCCCAAALPRCAAAGAARLLHATLCVHNTHGAQVKIDNHLKYILGLQPTNETHPRLAAEQKPNATPTARPESLETMLDAQTFRRTQVSPSIPCDSVPAFETPEFLTHAGDCPCYACETPSCFVLAFQTAGLEASVFFRAKETDIASNYFKGALRLANFVEAKLKHAFDAYRKMGFENYVVEIVERTLSGEYKSVLIDTLIEASFFELSLARYQKADDNIVRIHEILQESPESDQYTRNELMNLMCASAYLRKIIKSPEADETGLETELESLRLSPAKAQSDVQKTPESKAEEAPKVTRTKVVVKDEEVPNLKRKVIKLNLDDAADDSTSVAKPTRKQAQFKIPVPRTSKPVPETLTPLMQTKAQPQILVTQPTEDLPAVDELATPHAKKARDENQAKPSLVLAESPAVSEDVFYTPMTSVKTYGKKTLRRDLIKNLDKEFATPKGDEKENGTSQVRQQRTRRKVESGALRSLRRSASPGNLAEDAGLLKSVDNAERPRLRAKNPAVKGDKKK